MNASDLLHAPMLKVERAKHHINDLSARIDSYLAKRPFKLVTHGYPKADKEVHFIKEELPIPDEFSLIIGDAIHNLRSALDILIFTMIGDKATRPESVQFPFAKREDSLESTIHNRECKLAGEEVVAEIKSLKPYPGGNKWLSGLHALDIADKHKLVLPAASTATMSSLEFAQMLPGLTGREGVSVVMHRNTQFVQTFEGPRATRLANRRNIRPGEYERDVQPTFHIVLEEGQPFEAEPVVPVMVGITDEVAATLGKIARAFISANQ